MPELIYGTTLKLGNFYIVNNPLDKNKPDVLEIQYAKDPSNPIVIATFNPTLNYSNYNNPVFNFFPAAGNLNNTTIPPGTLFYAGNGEGNSILGPNMGINVLYPNGTGTGFSYRDYPNKTSDIKL